eukprot:693648-Rhodomonas_salina.1
MHTMLAGCATWGVKSFRGAGSADANAAVGLVWTKCFNHHDARQHVSADGVLSPDHFDPTRASPILGCILALHVSLPSRPRLAGLQLESSYVIYSSISSPPSRARDLVLATDSVTIETPCRCCSDPDRSCCTIFWSRS